MKQVKTTTIRDFNLVATFNSDPFFIEDEDLRNEVIKELGEEANRYDSSDEEFEDLAAKLDGDADAYQFIYSSNGVTIGELK